MTHSAPVHPTQVSRHPVLPSKNKKPDSGQNYGLHLSHRVPVKYRLTNIPAAFDGSRDMEAPRKKRNRKIGKMRGPTHIELLRPAV
jgi:hypothetical protein